MLSVFYIIDLSFSVSLKSEVTECPVNTYSSAPSRNSFRQAGYLSSTGFSTSVLTEMPVDSPFLTSSYFEEAPE
jgi:hypothetical protein